MPIDNDVMTVQDLKEELEKYPPNMPIYSIYEEFDEYGDRCIRTLSGAAIDVQDVHVLHTSEGIYASSKHYACYGIFYDDEIDSKKTIQGIVIISKKEKDERK